MVGAACAAILANTQTIMASGVDPKEFLFCLGLAVGLAFVINLLRWMFNQI